MATSVNTKVPPVQESSRDTSRQFTSLDPVITLENEASFEIEQTPEERRQLEAEERVEALKKCLGGWRVAGGVLGVMMVLGWVCIIAVLILEEKWQLVLIAWLLLYAAAHFCYWYFKRHNLMSFNSQMRERLSRMGNGEKSNDNPPTYDEVLKSEPPPPAYYSVVDESPKGFDKLRNALRATGAIPKVFRIGNSHNKNSTNFPNEESQIEKSSGSFVEKNDNSLYIIEEHFTNNDLPPTSSSRQTHTDSYSSEGLYIPNTSRAAIDAEQPPSYDSIDFDNVIVETSQLPSRRLSKVAVDIESQE